MKKERPILFSAPMVCAILDGSKTQTRRVMKPQPTVSESGWFSWDGHAPGSPYGAYAANHIDRDSINIFVGGCCPYGKPGDRLWVRETFCEWDDGFVYAATCSDQERSVSKFKPSIHMPRRASRINLEITVVRVERLNDISEKDAIAEGIEDIGNVITCWKDYQADGAFRDANGMQKGGIATMHPIDSFKSLWEFINGAGSWDANPWVWVVEFKPINA